MNLEQGADPALPLTLKKHETMRIDARNSEALFKALAAPVRFNNKLATAFEEHDQRVTSK